MLGRIDGFQPGGWQGLRRPGGVNQPDGQTTIPGLAPNADSSALGAIQTPGLLAISSVNMQVSQMLSSIGGGVQGDKTLEMMIALLILLALLQQSTTAQQSSAGLLDTLGRGKSSAPQVAYSSSTYVAYHTTQINIGASAGQEANPSADGDGRLDLSA
ncbi:MAG: hypothetical protein AABZ12_04730 [Planctomycetota bacterium]